MKGRQGTHPTLAPACICARVCPCESVFVPKWNNAFPLKGMCHPVLVWAELVSVTAAVTSTEGKGIFPVWGGTNFLLMNSVHLHNSQPCSHPHTADRFIIVCQESAGFTFQQNGTILHPHIHSYPRHRLSAHLNPTSSYPTLPANLPAHSGAARIQLRIHFSVTSFLSDFISFFLFVRARELGEEQAILTLNHSVSILNVLQA